MGYTLNAFIGPLASFKEQLIHLPNTRMVLLEQGIAMAPVRCPVPHPTSVAPFWDLTTEQYDAGARLSANGLVGYLEIELFGGHGERAAVLWKNQQVVFGPVMSEDSSSISNQLFSLLGVNKHRCYDEFEALGLGKYRSTEEWLAAS